MSLIQSLQNPEILRFIREHEHDDVSVLALKHQVVHGVPVALIANQIIGRQKARDKFPELYAHKNVVYPPRINLEQSSSEITARFKHRVVLMMVPEATSGVDLTGGFGIDTLYLSRRFREFHYVEPDASLLDIARHNHQVMGEGHIQHHGTTAENFLVTTTQTFDFAFIDPSRRVEGKKVFRFSDCAPNVSALRPWLQQGKIRTLLVKASPLIDLQQGIGELKSVNHVFVVSINNECKEVLFLCSAGEETDPVVEAVNIAHEGEEVLRFKFSEERAAAHTFSAPLGFLYEPNASVLKAGAFKILASNYDLLKIEKNTHLYTADVLRENFPGRIFKIIGPVKPDARDVKKFLPEGKANITTRNYPLTPEQLKKKTGLADGGEKFLIGFSGLDKKHLVVAERIK